MTSFTSGLHYYSWLPQPYYSPIRLSHTANTLAALLATTKRQALSFYTFAHIKMKSREWPLTVAFIYDRKVEHIAHGESPHEYSDLADDVTIGGITEALERLGHHVVHVPGLKALIKDIAAHRHKNWDVVFNYSKGSHGTARESQVPALLEEHQIPFTFSDAETLAICGDKGKTKVFV